MPTYDYECKACHHRFEEFQGIKDGVLRKCPECSKLKLQRLIGSGGALLFKGSGFYITDYRSKSYQDKAKSDKGDKGGSAKKPDKAAPKPDFGGTSANKKNSGGSGPSGSGS